MKMKQNAEQCLRLLTVNLINRRKKRMGQIFYKSLIFIKKNGGAGHDQLARLPVDQRSRMPTIEGRTFESLMIQRLHGIGMSAGGVGDCQSTVPFWDRMCVRFGVGLGPGFVPAQPQAPCTGGRGGM